MTELRNFLLNKEGKLINNTTPIPWPRTQDLEPLYEINHTMFLAKREVYEKQRNRIGKKPMLYVMDELHSFDIDWPDDFVIAETAAEIPSDPCVHDAGSVDAQEYAVSRSFVFVADMDECVHS